MAKLKKPDLKIHWVDIDSINTAEYNPRKITPKKKKELRDSIEKYGIREGLKLNRHPDRLNVLISGHQRLKIAKDLGFEKVPVTFENLNLEDEKEFNLRLNKNGGEFDNEMLVMVADRTKLLDIGFNASELPKLLTDFEEKFEGIDTSEPVYPITPKFNEKYDFVMIFTKTEMDFTWLKNVLGIERKIDYKSKNMGECRVIDVKDFQEKYSMWLETESK